MYAWTKRQGVPEAERQAQDTQSDEMRRLKAELKRVTKEHDILKKAESGCGFARAACCLPLLPQHVTLILEMLSMLEAS